MSFGQAVVCGLVYVLMRYLDYGITSWQAFVRPLVVGPIVGALLGDLQTGLVMGASLEAIFMGISAIGGAVPSDSLSGTIIPVAYAISVGASQTAMETGLALAIPIGTVVSTISSMLFSLWGAMSAYWENLAAQAKPKKFTIQALVIYFFQEVPCGIVIALAVYFGVDAVQAVLDASPAWVMTGLSTAGSMMTAIGFGILLSMIWDTSICIWYFVGFILAESLGLSSLGIAIIGAAIALTIFFLEKKVIDAKNELATSTITSTVASDDEEDFF